MAWTARQCLLAESCLSLLRISRLTRVRHDVVVRSGTWISQPCDWEDRDEHSRQELFMIQFFHHHLGAFSLAFTIHLPLLNPVRRQSVEELSEGQSGRLTALKNRFHEIRGEIGAPKNPPHVAFRHAMFSSDRPQ